MRIEPTRTSALSLPSPHRNENPERPAFPIATWILIALTLCGYLIQILVDDNEASELILRFGVTPEIVSGGDKPFGSFPPWLTPLTAMFLHGSWDHLLVNMIFLWVFGDDIENVLGSVRFAIFYVLCGLCGAAGYIATDPNASIALVGASGNIAGLLTAYLMLKPCEPVALPLLPARHMIASYWAIGVWVLLQLFQFLWHADEEQFTNQAFFGGAIGGAILFVALRPRGLKLFQCLSHDHDVASRHD